MTTFFPLSGPGHTRGKVRWQDFVHAMSKLGFSIECRAGSACYFEPTWNPEEPVSIHRPHPSDEIRLDMIRWYASRLRRKYGWTSETFMQL